MVSLNNFPLIFCDIYVRKTNDSDDIFLYNFAFLIAVGLFKISIHHRLFYHSVLYQRVESPVASFSLTSLMIWFLLHFVFKVLFQNLFCKKSFSFQNLFCKKYIFSHKHTQTDSRLPRWQVYVLWLRRYLYFVVKL